MKSEQDIENLEKLIGQLKALHTEISVLSKKSPSDAVNTFKLKLINKSLAFGNEVLGASYKPFDDFEAFDSDDMPSNSDVTMVLAQYLEEAERYRSDNVTMSSGWYYYKLNGERSAIRSAPPTWSKK
ncbi:hypothetical protein [Phaeobacter inhibens]|uniref:hypothetical protein n=1 Tax=Phaeobacter inhibens TaxID=221822 RepID=UPI000C9C6851|nr:hypothetical protein [Phaeobacter inhibens]AUQ63189.1 hypothetical protein PhaeoP51_02218 [Phaeobacter inhibens]AUQ83093.1 hypothetical protein PhaeoP57_02177 [Phaeobacter inhibens]AUQ90854.1 hypothetical protein PhaeoP24_02251 [Phaeobacter inhibens]